MVLLSCTSSAERRERHIFAVISRRGWIVAQVNRSAVHWQLCLTSTSTTPSSTQWRWNLEKSRPSQKTHTFRYVISCFSYREGEGNCYRYVSMLSTKALTTAISDPDVVLSVGVFVNERTQRATWQSQRNHRTVFRIRRGLGLWRMFVSRLVLSFAPLTLVTELQMFDFALFPAP